jgi:ATP adenylyltransferase
VILDSNLPDEETFIVWRGEECFAVMNLHPYTSGHVMVLPKRAVAELADLTDNESAELWEGVRAAVAAVTAAFSPHGINVGANLGRGAGAGIPDHLHIHVVPRWDGDTNFMTTIANTRVLPEAMIDSWRRIVAAWP